MSCSSPSLNDFTETDDEGDEGDVVTYGGGSTTAAPSNGVSKTLQYGDTVWDFATAHGYSVSQCTVPSGNINVYYPGDVVTCR